MDRNTAKALIEKTFKSSYDEKKFRYFIKNIFKDIEEVDKTIAGQFIKKAYSNKIKSYKRLFKYTSPDSKKDIIDVVAIKLDSLSSLKRARTLQRNLIAHYIDTRGKDAVLAAFYTDEDNAEWRFSFIKKSVSYVPDTTKTLKSFTPAKRYSFLVGENESCHTAQSQLYPLLEIDRNNPKLKELENAFSIEKITKEFFDKYKGLYLLLVEKLEKIISTDNKIKEEFNKNKITPDLFCKKLLGQIVFLYFLQKKGWLGAPKGKNWGEGNKRFLQTLFNTAVEKNKNYFNDYLEPLFYEALATERDHDYYNDFNCRIPFLNGGLFEPIQDYDWVNTEIIIPNEVFANDAQKGIFDIFDIYNFTVKEDEPLEKEVAVDPEMLGKVFEELLEVKDRKSQGAFYTPREIVHYMCQESLINYIHGQLPQISHEDISFLIHYGDTFQEMESMEGKMKGHTQILPKSIKQNATQIDDALSNIKICDPAVGSGAFLVGAMHEIVRARLTLFNSEFIPDDKNNTKDTTLNEDTDYTKEVVYKYKREAIQNSLFGVDIVDSAVEITKLRLWLSLVVDEENIKEINPLPNLEYTIIHGDSLLHISKDDWINNITLEDLKGLKTQYFNAVRRKDKINLDKQIRKIIDQQIDEGSFDLEIYFPEVFSHKKGFDLIIGNPPYISSNNMDKKYKKRKEIMEYVVHQGATDIYTYFYERGLNLLNPSGLLCFITSNKWMRTKYGGKLRTLIKDNTSIQQIIDLGGQKIFENATVDPNIIIFSKQKPTTEHQFLYGNNLPSTELALKKIKQSGDTFLLESPETLEIKYKIEKIGTPLHQWDNLDIFMGIKTGRNEAFIISNEQKKELCRQDPKSAEIIKPLLQGVNISPHVSKWAELWIINTHNGYYNKDGKKIKSININNYPAIKEHLKQYVKKLMSRTDQGNTYYNLRSCSYIEEFKKEKIICPDIAPKLTASIDTNSIYILNTCYIIRCQGQNKYILALFNSQLIDFYFSLISSQLGKKARRHIHMYLRRIPLIPISINKQKPFNKLVDIILHKKEKGQSTEIEEKQIDQLVYKLYELTPAQIKIVEDRAAEVQPSLTKT